jgi:hypothetical protein
MVHSIGHLFPRFFMSHCFAAEVIRGSVTGSYGLPATYVA